MVHSNDGVLLLNASKRPKNEMPLGTVWPISSVFSHHYALPPYSSRRTSLLPKYNPHFHNYTTCAHKLIYSACRDIKQSQYLTDFSAPMQIISERHSITPTPDETTNDELKEPDIKAPEEEGAEEEEEEEHDDDDMKPMLRAFDGIAGPPSRKPLATRYAQSCCIANGFKCRRIGSSRIYNEAVYRSSSYCIVGPHFPATIFIVFFISGATYFFGERSINRAQRVAN